jgi:hypothetical protein
LKSGLLEKLATTVNRNCIMHAFSAQITKFQADTTAATPAMKLECGRFVTPCTTLIKRRKNMHHVKHLLLAIGAAALLSGCTTTYRETLDQKLEGKSPAEKRIILAQECGAEINKGIKKDDPKNVSHFEKMKQICEEMTGKKINAGDSQ